MISLRNRSLNKRQQLKYTYIRNFEIFLCLQTLVCLFWFPMFIYIFLIVYFGFNVYLHFFGVNTLCFEKFLKIFNWNFENFEISLCLQMLVSVGGIHYLTNLDRFTCCNSLIHRSLYVECAKNPVVFFFFTMSVFQIADHETQPNPNLVRC